MTFNRTDVSLLKQVNKYVRENCPIFYTHCIKLEESQSRATLFSFILSHLFFISNATNFVGHSSNRFVLKKIPAYVLLVFFNWVPFPFLAYGHSH